jgi:hypothetical protein
MCQKNGTMEHLHIRPLSGVLHDVTAETFPNLLRLACCRKKHSTAAHALLNHDATHLGPAAWLSCISHKQQQRQQQHTT